MKPAVEKQYGLFMLSAIMDRKGLKARRLRVLISRHVLMSGKGVGGCNSRREQQETRTIPEIVAALFLGEARGVGAPEPTMLRINGQTPYLATAK
jgi:hypothetical protein